MSREDYAWLAEIVSRKIRRVPKNEKRKAESPRQELPLFDASKWRPTPKALEMLGETKKPIPPDVEREMRIAENERKYGGQLTHTDRIVDRLSLAHGRNYRRIESLAGTNGECHSRKTTYRRFKFGKGNLSRKGWLKAGFDENRKPKGDAQ